MKKEETGKTAAQRFTEIADLSGNIQIDFSAHGEALIIREERENAFSHKEKKTKYTLELVSGLLK